MDADNQFPLKIEDVEPEQSKKLLEYFTGKLIYLVNLYLHSPV